MTLFFIYSWFIRQSNEKMVWEWEMRYNEVLSVFFRIKPSGEKPLNYLNIP